MRSPNQLRKNGMFRESTTSRTQDETDHDSADDASVGNQSLADQARRSWMKKDAKIQSSRSLMTEQHQPPSRHTQSPGRFKVKSTMPSLGNSRWSTSAASVTNSLKAPMSWHGGKGKLSPSRFAANFTPPISKRKNASAAEADNSPKLPSKSPSPKRGEDGKKKSVGNFIRGNKIYKIETPFNAVKSFVPIVSSGSSVKSSTSKASKASRWSTNSHDTRGTAGISVEPLPDRLAAKKRAEKEPALVAPMEEEEEEEDEEDYEEDYEDEVLDLNDDGEEEDEEDYGPEEEMPVTFDTGPVREFVVDRVPRKRYASRNVENFPIWPPIIKVRGYEAARGGNVSAISVGSGFTDDDYLTDDFSTDEEASFTEKARTLPPAQRTSYRIRYDGPTKLNLDVYKEDNRFASTVEHVQPDGAPNLPARNMDSTPGMPPRRQSEHSHEIYSDAEYSEDLSDAKEFHDDSKHQTRPDVWITALSGEEEENVIWNVRRVWDVEKEDEGEKEVSVHSQQLFSKIKSLVGADEDSLGADRSQAGTVTTTTTAKSDVKPKMPTRSWQIQKVVESKGKLDDLEPEKDLDDNELVQDIQVMNTDAVAELKENIKAQEELIRKITQRRIEKKEKAAKGEVEPEVEDTEEAAPPLSKEEQEKWLREDDSMEGSMHLAELVDKEPMPPPANTPQRIVSDSADTLISMQESIVSTKIFDASSKEPVIEESTHSIENDTPASSTAKIEKASETASVNSLDSLPSSESKAATSVEEKGLPSAETKDDTPVEEKAPLPPPPPPQEEPPREQTPPPPPPPAPTPSAVTPPQKHRSLSPKSSPKTPKNSRKLSPKRKSGKKKESRKTQKSPRTPTRVKSVPDLPQRSKSSKKGSESPRTPLRHTMADEAPRTPRRNYSDEDLAQAQSSPLSKSEKSVKKRERRKGKKRKDSKKKAKKPITAGLLTTSSDESDIEERRPSSDKGLMKHTRDRQPSSPKRRSTTVDARKLSMAAMVVHGSDSDSDDSSDSNTDAATKNLMKKHQPASGAATPWWKKQQQQAASKKGARPGMGSRRVQSDRYLGRK